MLADAWMNLIKRQAADQQAPQALVSFGAVRDIGSDHDVDMNNISTHSSLRNVVKVPRHHHHHHPAGHAQPPPAVISEARRAQRRESRIRRQQEMSVFSRINNSRSEGLLRNSAAMTVSGSSKEFMFVDDEEFDDDDETGSGGGGGNDADDYRDDGGERYQSPTPYYFEHNHTYQQQHQHSSPRRHAAAVPDHVGAALAKFIASAGITPPSDMIRNNSNKNKQAVHMHLEPQRNAILLEPSLPPDNSIIDTSAGFSPVPLHPLAKPSQATSPQSLYMFGSHTDNQQQECSDRIAPAQAAQAVIEKERHELLQKLLAEQRSKREQSQDERWRREDERQSELFFHRQKSPPSAVSPMIKNIIDLRGYGFPFNEEGDEVPPPRSAIASANNNGGKINNNNNNTNSSIDKKFEMQQEQQHRQKLTSLQVRSLKAVHSRDSALRVLPLLPASQREIVKCALVEDLCALTSASVLASESFVRRGAMVTPLSVIDRDA